MKFSRAAIVAVASLLAAGSFAPVTADMDPDELPVAIAVGLPEGSGAELNDDPVAATGDVVLAAQSKPSCRTQAIPPQEIDVLDPTSVTGRTELSCEGARYDAILTVELRYYGNNSGGPTGSGAVVKSATVYDFTPVTAVTKISKLDAKPGWYKTTGVSKVIYPYRLNTKKPAGQGCKYLTSNQIFCKVASSPVYVETLGGLTELAREIIPISD